MDERLRLLHESFTDVKIVWKDDYQYFIHPLTDGVPRLDSELLKAVSELIFDRVEWDDIDIILGIEAMGLPLASTISLMTNKPTLVARKRGYGLEGETVVSQQTGYSKGELYLNDLSSEDRVLVIDDVISTGGTLDAIIDGVLRTGASLNQVVIVVEKGDAMDEISLKHEIPISSLVKVEMDGDIVKIQE